MIALLGKQHNTMSNALNELLNRGVIWRGRDNSFSSEGVACQDLSCFLESAAHRRRHVEKEALSFGVSQIDESLSGGLEGGGIHEWAVRLPNELAWLNEICPAPLLLMNVILAHNLQRVLKAENTGRCSGKGDHRCCSLVWIGRSIWPSGFLQDATICDRALGDQVENIFVDALSVKDRLWSALQSLRMPGVFAVLYDARGFSFKDSRKLQLAARNGNTFGIAFRTVEELEQPSCVHTRWDVEPISDVVLVNGMHESLAIETDPRSEYVSWLKEKRVITASDITVTNNLGDCEFSWNLTLKKARNVIAPKQWGITLDRGTRYESFSFDLSAKPVSGSC